MCYYKYMNYLPHKLVKLRKHYNYSQSYLAEILDIDVLEYMGYENGRAVISYEQCKKLASFYHVGIIDMFRNDDQVPLYEVAKAHTDELNIEYFIPRKTPIQKFFSLIRRHKIMTGLVCGAFVLLLVISIVLLKKNNDPYTAVLLEKNRLAVSDTSVVYIEEFCGIYANFIKFCGILPETLKSKAGFFYSACPALQLLFVRC